MARIMTAPPKFGTAIAVGGVRPVWLPDDVEVSFEIGSIWTLSAYIPTNQHWAYITAIRLEVPRYDFVYLALERGMVPNMGEDTGPPTDWDQDPDTVLYRDGRTGAECHHFRSPNAWDFTPCESDIIGYTRKATPTALPLAHPAAPQGEEDLAACKAVNEIIAVLIRRHVPDFAERVRIGNEATTAILAALAPAAIASGRGEGE